MRRRRRRRRRMNAAMLVRHVMRSKQSTGSSWCAARLDSLLRVVPVSVAK